MLYAVPEGPPARFRWRRVVYLTARFEGPERIAPEWWRDRPGTRLRDYYKVEVGDGRRFWLFREGIWGTDAAVIRAGFCRASCVTAGDASVTAPDRLPQCRTARVRVALWAPW